MQGKKLFFIYNPYAGKEQIRQSLFEIIDVFVKRGYEVTVYPTQKPGDAVERIKLLEPGYELIVCSGGDGTLDEVVTGLMQSKKKIPIGYISAGSTNDFAASLNLPKNMVQAATVAVGENFFSCDVGKLNQDFFIYVAAFGLFTDVSYKTSQDMKNVIGHMAYILEGVKRLPTLDTFHMKVELVDSESGEEVHLEEDFLFGMVTNSTSIGGFKRITGKNVVFDDGLYEVMLIKKPQRPVEWNNLIGAMMLGEMDAECMFSYKTEKVIFRSEKKVAWTTDGEFGGEHEIVEIENIPRAIDIKIP